MFKWATARSKYLNYDVLVFMSQKIVFIVANSADPVEIPFYGSSLFAYIQNEKGWKILFVT